MYKVIGAAEPIGEAAILKYPASVGRHREKPDRFLSGFMVLGDCISSFNPVYGQGMSVEDLGAMELHAPLAEGKANWRAACSHALSSWSMFRGASLPGATCVCQGPWAIVPAK